MARSHTSIGSLGSGKVAARAVASERMSDGSESGLVGNSSFWDLGRGQSTSRA